MPGTVAAEAVAVEKPSQDIDHVAVRGAGPNIAGVPIRVPVDSLNACPYRTAKTVQPLESAEFTAHSAITVMEDESGVPCLVTDGLRRIELARAKGIKEIDAINIGRPAEEELLKHLLKTGLSQADRDPFETLDQILALRDLRPALDSSRKLGPAIGASHTQVQKVLRLADVAPETRCHFRAETLDRGGLFLLAKMKDPKKQADLADRFVNGDITRADVRDAIDAATGRHRKKKSKGKAPVIFDRDVELILAQVRGLKSTASAEQRLDLARRLRAEADAIEKTALGEAR